MTSTVEDARLGNVPSNTANRYDDAVAKRDPALLWRTAAEDVQGGHFDDRPLYWARLKLARQLGEREEVERRSRNFAFAGAPGDVLVTGFDPFHLDRDIGQSNPSGLAALALDGTVVGGALVRSAILPVRFCDFDQGIVEDLLTPHFQRGLALALTVSMGRDAFDLERFPGRRRSATALDNENLPGGGSATEPLVPPGIAGPEFLEFSLPAAAMVEAQGRWAVRDNRRVTTLEHGEVHADSLAALAADTAVAGSSGGFLSNEIAYRSLLLARRLGVSFPLGHLHTPAVRGHEAALELDMVRQIRRILEAALG